jgi:hypothetical protein
VSVSVGSRRMLDAGSQIERGYVVAIGYGSLGAEGERDRDPWVWKESLG